MFPLVTQPSSRPTRQPEHNCSIATNLVYFNEIKNNIKNFTGDFKRGNFNLMFYSK